MKNIKVSVIVPIYNVENYLRECLDSLERQTLNAIEVIMVNDGSTDASGKIAGEYSARNTNFTLLEQQNGGLSAARNTGLKKAVGEYVYFLDSDDYLLDTALEELYDEAKEKNLDVLKFSAYTFKEPSAELIWNGGGYKYKGEYPGVYEGIHILKTFIRNDDYCFPSCCLIFTRRDIIKAYHLQFYEGIIHEDNLFHFQLMLLSKRVAVMNRPLYCRRIRAGSITQTLDLINKARSLCVSIEEGERFLKQYPSVRNTTSEWYVMSWIYSMITFWQKMNYRMRWRAETRGYYRRVKKIAREHHCYNDIIVRMFMFSKPVCLLWLYLNR